MKFGSVCSGIEAASVAWHPLGWKAAWLSEIEPFPSAVLAHHYPDVPNHGDMTTLPDRIRSGEVEAPDVFCGGTPCQAFSVAGQRKSLNDARGNLSLTFCEIANAIDERRANAGSVPGIVFWENVPGVLNTKDNAFGCFLAELAGESVALESPGGKWPNAGCILGPKRTVAWRVLDAQYFGLAQRRRRVFVVASSRNDFDPLSVLFEFEGVRRDSAPRRETGQNAAKCLTAGAAQRLDFETEDFVTQPAYALQGSMIGRNDNAGPAGSGINEEVCFTQNTIDRHGVAQPIAFPANMSATQHASTEDLAPAMAAKNPTAVAFQSSQSGVRVGDTHATLDANNGSRRHNGALIGMSVRRLTPVECERLQGFPDNYTAIPWRKKPADECPDGPRYKALGNSWAVPVVRWIGSRIHTAILKPANDNAVQATQVAA